MLLPACFFHAGSFLHFVVFLKIRRQEVHWKPKVWKPNVTQKISLTENPSDWFSWKQINLDNNGIRSHRFHSAESRACVPLTSQADILDAVQLIHYAFEFCLQSSFQSRLIPKKICLLLLRHQKNQVNYFNQQKQTKKKTATVQLEHVGCSLRPHFKRCIFSVGHAGFISI